MGTKTTSINPRVALAVAFVFGWIALFVVSFRDDSDVPDQEQGEPATDLDMTVEMRPVPAAPGGGGGAPDRSRDTVVRPKPRDILRGFCSPAAYRIVGARLERGFERAHPGVDLVLQVDGDRNCIDHLLMGSAEVAVISTRLSETERSRGVVAHVVGYQIVVPIVHPENPVRTVSYANLRDLRRGTATSWRTFGWTDLQIQPVCKVKAPGVDPPDELLRVHGAAAHTAVYLTSPREILALVGNNPAALGWVTLRDVDGNRDVRPLQVDGVTASRHSFVRESWRIGSTFRVVAGPRPGPWARQWLDYMRGDEARRVLGRELTLPKR